MAIIDSPKTALDNTVQIFDQFYNFSASVNASEYDIVYSYFESVCSSTNVAQNFTTFLFRISSITEIPVMQLLENIRSNSNSKLELNAVIAYYLNSFKTKTSLYGISVVPQPNQAVQRNVVV